MAELVLLLLQSWLLWLEKELGGDTAILILSYELFNLPNDVPAVGQFREASAQARRTAQPGISSASSARNISLTKNFFFLFFRNNPHIYITPFYQNCAHSAIMARHLPGSTCFPLQNRHT